MGFWTFGFFAKPPGFTSVEIQFQRQLRDTRSDTTGLYAGGDSVSTYSYAIAAVTPPALRRGRFNFNLQLRDIRSDTSGFTPVEIQFQPRGTQYPQ